MGLGLDPAQRDLAIGLLATMSVFCAILVVLWPYLVRDTLGERMRQVAGERERIRQRERSRLSSGRQPAGLRREPARLFGNIARGFHLTERLSNGEIGRLLRMAGYRGNASMITFLVIRLAAPPAMFAVTLLYVLFVLRLSQPLSVSLAIAANGAALGYYLPTLFVKNRIAKRQQSILRAWPDALDLMLICVESGMGIESALRKVSEEMGVQSVALAEELMVTTAELSFLQDRQQAYDNLSQRTGLDAVKAGGKTRHVPRALAARSLPGKP